MAFRRRRRAFLTGDNGAVTTHWMRQCFPLSIACVAVWFLTGCQPRGVDALRRGDELRRSGRLAEAIPMLQQAVVDLPREPRTWNFLGLAWHAAGRMDEAQRAYLHALEQDRNFSEVHFNLGALFSERGEWLEVEKALRAFLTVESNRTNAVAWRMLGEAQWHNKSFDQAQRCLAVAVKSDGKNPDVWNLLGLVETARKHFAEAQQDFSYAIFLAPQHSAALFNQAVLAQQHFGDRKTASLFFRRYLNTSPTASNSESVRNLIRQLETGTNGVPSAESRPTESRPAGDSMKSGTNTVAIPSTPIVAPASPVSPHPPPGSGVESKTGTIRPEILAHSTNHLAQALPHPSLVTNALVSPKSISLSSPRPDLAIESPRPLTTATPEIPLDPAPLDVVQIQDNPPLGGVPEVIAVPENSSPAATLPKPLSPKPTDETTIRVPSDSPALVGAVDGYSSPAGRTGIDDKVDIWTRLNPIRWGNPRNWFSASDPAVGANSVAFDPARDTIPPPARLTAPPPVSLPVSIRRYPRSYTNGLVPGDRATAELRIAAGSDAWDSGNRSAAAEAFQQAATSDPVYFTAQYNLAVVSLAMGNIPAALLAGEASVIADPFSANAHRVFAAALVRSNYPVDAAEELEKLIQIQPTDADAHLSLGGLYANQLAQPIKAKSFYQRVLALQPQHPQAAGIRNWLAHHP